MSFKTRLNLMVYILALITLLNIILLMALNTYIQRTEEGKANLQELQLALKIASTETARLSRRTLSIQIRETEEEMLQIEQIIRQVVSTNSFWLSQEQERDLKSVLESFSELLRESWRSLNTQAQKVITLTPPYYPVLRSFRIDRVMLDIEEILETEGADQFLIEVNHLVDNISILEGALDRTSDTISQWTAIIDRNIYTQRLRFSLFFVLSFLISYSIAIIWILRFTQTLDIKLTAINISAEEAWKSLKTIEEIPQEADEIDHLYNQISHLLKRIISDKKLLKATNEELTKNIKIMGKTQRYLTQAEIQLHQHRLVKGIAHNVNTPLGVCITLTSALLDNLDSLNLEPQRERDLEEQLSFLMTNLQKAVTLMNQIRDIKTDIIKEENEQLDILQVIKEYASMTRAEREEAGIELILTIPQNIKVKSSRQALTQCLNLMFKLSLDNLDPHKSLKDLEIKVSRRENQVQIHYIDHSSKLPDEETYFSTNTRNLMDMTREADKRLTSLYILSYFIQDHYHTNLDFNKTQEGFDITFLIGNSLED